ncbi:hypothetical protein [Paenibacillus sp. FSL L8-0709]|uniref:hypothetical protein n=1 Tax=Paenibacillus sp. FSL L8-0709 TaxID=2975312 RepID=UPI0030FBFFF0
MSLPLRKPYRGKIIDQNIWLDNTKVREVLMQPGLVGSYTWIANEPARSKQILYHGHFHMALIEDDTISFWGENNNLLISIRFDEGEVQRILKTDNWFKSEHWFKVLISELQLTLF